jgi:hypothetical protein
MLDPSQQPLQESDEFRAQVARLVRLAIASCARRVPIKREDINKRGLRLVVVLLSVRVVLTMMVAVLQGHTRARVVREVGDRSYRLAELEPLRQTHDLEIDVGEDRQRLERVFRPALLGGTPVGRQFRQLLAGPMRTADVADLIAFNYLDDVPLKQSLLEETDVRHRVRRILEALEVNQPSLQLAYLRDTADPELN